MGAPRLIDYDVARRLLADGVSPRDIAAQFGVTARAIGHVKLGRKAPPGRAHGGGSPRLPWCPPDRLADYRALRSKVGAAEARRFIEADLAHRAKQEARHGASSRASA